MKQTNLLKGILAIVVLLCSTHAWAYDFEEGNIQYTVTSVNKLTVEVSGLSDKNVIEVVIPETVEYKSRTLTVTSIGSRAFYSCTGLERVTIPNCVTTIGDYAFQGCTGLTEVTIPNSVTSIGNYAFSGCIGLTGTLTIPNSVTKIGDYAFSGCIRLTEVTIPNSVTSIGSYAFEGCTRLTSVTIGESVTKIGKSAFSGCSGLTEVNFNATACTSAGSSDNRAFYGCGNISTVRIGDNVTIIPNYLFYDCTELTDLTIPESVTEIGGYAFYNCSSLKDLDIPNSVTSLGDYAFHGCKGLETLEIGAGMEYLLDYFLNDYAGIRYENYYLYYPVLWGDGPSNMESIILKDGTSNFSIRGYGETGYDSGNYQTPKSGIPLFSKINIGYYYVGRPLIDIDSWTYTFQSYDASFEISISRPYGTIKTLEIGGYCTEVPYFYQRISYLILGENVKYYTGNIYQGDLKAIICRSAVPPTLSGTFENSTYVNTIVYVPIGSKATYEATDGWKTFWDIQELDMQSIPPGYSDAVESITAYGQADVIGYYGIDGKKVSTPQRGINIIRYSDGTARKVLMR